MIFDWFKRKPLPVCVDCAYCQESLDSGGRVFLCTRLPITKVDIVTGQISLLQRLCEIERINIFGFCGEKGRYFKKGNSNE